MAAKKNSKQTPEARAAREAEFTESTKELETIITSLDKRLSIARSVQKKNLPLLESVSLGLYEEMDKLSKKAPAETVTDLALAQLNDVIRETKLLITEDAFVQRLSEFVPAGDNPELRDAVVVLRQLRQGLERFRSRLRAFDDEVPKRLLEARMIRAAIQYYIDSGYVPGKDDLADTVREIPNRWLDKTYPQGFDFEKLSQTDLTEYFAVE